MKKCKVFGMLAAAPIGLPSLGVEPQVVIAGGVVSSKDKKPGEKWISPGIRYFEQHSGINAQVFLSSEKSH